ncbi:MAG: 4'-phosphopantetheinyl transferase superfamily protein [Deltaproteobacteria bacterium]|nr:4'-phosphopantetheinyl transferase superfamily protein [Deltaproteobacteria bacterium]
MIDRRLRRTTPHGVLVAVEVASEITDLSAVELHEEEIGRAQEYRGARRTSFVAGRVALAEALAMLGAPRVAIGTDDRGAPTPPLGFVGSISHKGALGVALAAVDQGARVGVDVERLGRLRDGVAELVLVPKELDRLPPRAEADERTAAVLTAFSVKEAIYKAIDPFVRRYVGYHEAHIVLPPRAAMRGGFARVEVSLELSRGESIAALEAWVLEHEGVVISTARADQRPAAARSSASSRAGS